MDRAATDVAASPAAKGDLPSFEELLAEGSFQARIARARAEREKALAVDAGRPDDFILNTSKKPWDKDTQAAPEPDRAVAALNALSGETAQVHPFPKRPRVMGAPENAAAEAPRTGPVLDDADTPAPGLDAAAMPPPTPRVTPVAARQAVIQALKSAPGSAAAPSRPSVEGKPYQVPPVLDAAVAAGAAARAPRRRAFLVAGGFAAGLAFGIVATVLPGRFGGDAARPGRVALAPAAQAPAAGVDLTALRNPVIVAAAPTPIAPPSEAASLPDLAASSPVPAVPRAAPEAIAPVSLDAAPVTVAIGPGIDAIAPAVPTAPVTADPQPAVVALASVAVSPALPPALGGTVADQPPAAQPLPAAFTPAEEVTAAPDAAPLAPAFEGRLVVHAPDSVPEAEFGKVLSQLEEAGYPLSESSRVPFTIKDDNVRYFHAADAELAAAIAEDLGAKARDFTSFSPAPPAGTIEIWLSGRGSAPAASKPRSTGSRSAADQKLQALRSRILNQLRNGDHL